MTAWLKPPVIYDGTGLLRDHVMRIEDGHVAAIVPSAAMPTGTRCKQLDTCVGPALFDIQVNGGGEVMLNNRPTPEGVRRIAEAHQALGTAHILPTVITDSTQIMEKAALAVLESCGQNGVLGVHIEGPHISKERRGTHNPDFIRPFDDQMLALLETLRDAGLPVLLTLAPECVPPGTIARLDAIGVVVSAGHSAASPDVIKRAIGEGLRCFTHLFNGMPQLHSREPGIVGTAINSDLWCSIIADGHHVDDDMVLMASNARPMAKRMILISDAMSTVGGSSQFELYGETIRVLDGRLVNAAGSLAGAHIDLSTCVERAHNDIGIDMVQAIDMASAAPRALMRMPAYPVIGSKVEELSQIRL